MLGPLLAFLLAMTTYLGYGDQGQWIGYLNGQPLNVMAKPFSATGDGTTDDTQAISDCIDQACQTDIPGSPYFPPNRLFKVTSGFTIPRAITLQTVGLPAGGIAGTQNASTATILHDFDGYLFTFTGSDGALPGSGGGIRNLRLVNTFGGVQTANGRGYAVLLTGVDANNHASWTILENVIAENGFGDSWTGLLHVDGITPNALISDLEVRHCSAHVPASNGEAIKLEYASGQFTNNKFYQTGANVSVSGASGKVSSACNFTANNIAGTFALDWASGINLVGGIVTTITDTVNTAGINTLIPGQLSNPFTSLSGTCGLLYWDGSKWVTTGAAKFNGSVTLATLGSGGGLVSVGAADSGGAGFKLLRVPN